MINSLDAILEEISKAEIKLGNKTGRVPINLFETTELIDLNFNGFNSLRDYDYYCEDLICNFKNHVDNVNDETNSPLGIRQGLNLLLFEAKSQEKRYFPKKNKIDWLVKTSFKIKYQTEYSKEGAVRENVIRYLEIQKRLISRCIRLIEHRIKHLDIFSPPHQVNPYSSMAPFNDNFPPLLSDQLSLFPNGNCTTLLSWNRSKADLLELIVALNKTNSIGSNNGPILQKDLISIFGKFFNVELTSAKQGIAALKRRKKPESSYTKEIAETFRVYCEDT